MNGAPCIDLCGSDNDEETSTSKQKIMSMARAANAQTGRGPSSINANIHPPQSTRANTAMLTGSKRRKYLNHGILSNQNEDQTEGYIRSFKELMPVITFTSEDVGQWYFSLPRRLQA